MPPPLLNFTINYRSQTIVYAFTALAIFHVSCLHSVSVVWTVQISGDSTVIVAECFTLIESKYLASTLTTCSFGRTPGFFTILIIGIVSLTLLRTHASSRTSSLHLHRYIRRWDAFGSWHEE